MHASPPFQMIVRRFGVWQAALVLLVCAAAMVLAAWAQRAIEVHLAAVCIALAVLVLSSVATLFHALHLRPASLRWDTQRWHLGPMATAGHEPGAGRLMVALDLGAWMLLRFVPEEGSRWHRGTWLPVQRLGHEASWPALRTTVYCARPVSLPTVAPF
ncbi:MAG TPA: hypothetical protein VFL64_18760 [Rhizobacter sp.]|nr:hypothetical protein [Rhizobacter sp.]